MRSIALLVFSTVLGVLGAGTHRAELSHQNRQEGAVKDSFSGTWVANLSTSKLHPSFQYRSVTLDVTISGTMATMASRLVDEAGKEVRAAETFPTDGTESPGTLTPGVTLIARWLGPDVLASIARKDGRTVALVTYEVSADRKTLTSRSSGSLEQVLVFERR